MVNGFTQGFDIGYRGPIHRKNTSRNILFKDGVGSREEMWGKLMKEVSAKQYSGPFSKIPFEDHYVQSPIGLVPKAGGQTRLIFYLSFDFEDFMSVNHYTPAEMCSVKYNNLDHAVRNALFYLHDHMNACIWFAKSDAKSAFRVLPLSPGSWWLLVMKAEDPVTSLVFYFVDKCLPFRSSISCSHYQRFSDLLAHIMRHLTGQSIVCFTVTNYLDDFLFIEITKRKCN